VDLAAAPRAAGQAGQRGELDLHALRPGDVIEAAQGEAALARGVTISDPGVVRWTLAPGGRAVVREISARGAPARHVIALERGSLQAEVTPRDPSEGLVEAFTVEVGRTRVAVHGTRFTATRRDDEVEVEVHRGIVAVGPAGDAGATTARILIAPSRAVFSLDGGRTARLLDPSLSPSPAAPAAPVALELPPPATAQALTLASQGAPVAPHAAAPRPPSPVAPAATLPADAGAASASPSSPPPLTPASVRASLAGCFASRRPAGSPSVHTSIVSTMRVSVRGDGSVAAVRFDPPLRPELQACAQLLYAGRFSEATAREIAIPVRIDE
jgi:hypothetical protein